MAANDADMHPSRFPSVGDPYQDVATVQAIERIGATFTDALARFGETALEFGRRFDLEMAEAARRTRRVTRGERRDPHRKDMTGTSEDTQPSGTTPGGIVRIRARYVTTETWDLEFVEVPSRAREFDQALAQVRAEAWDEGYRLGINGHTGPGNPYREVHG